ncbi:hypothetical protein GCM10011414_16480 [Croceivirga lutea]|nr:hypothetical protein GCM10011414_16480 [Croceivirga lutea]
MYDFDSSTVVSPNRMAIVSEKGIATEPNDRFNTKAAITKTKSSRNENLYERSFRIYCKGVKKYGE